MAEGHDTRRAVLSLGEGGLWREHQHHRALPHREGLLDGRGVDRTVREDGGGAGPQPGAGRLQRAGNKS